MSSLTSIVALDFDGCIAHGDQAKIRFAKEYFGLELTIDQTAEECFPLGRQKYREMMDTVSSEWIGEYELAPDCREVMCELVGSGYRLRVVTSRFDRELAAAQSFTSTHNLPVEGFHNTNQQNKRAVCKELKPAAMLDDTLGKLVDLEGVVPHLYFMRQPWNVHEYGAASGLASDGRVSLVDSWREFGQMLLPQLQG